MEIQKTFYTPIKEETAKNWREEVPENFEFTMKAPQTITHPPNSPIVYQIQEGEYIKEIEKRENAQRLEL